MGAYSEKTQRSVDKYIRRLVRRMPPWLRTLFDEERIVFIVDPAGQLYLNVDESLTERIKGTAQNLINSYIAEHEIDFIETKYFQ